MEDLTPYSIEQLKRLARLLKLTSSFDEQQELQHVLAELRSRGVDSVSDCLGRTI